MAPDEGLCARIPSRHYLLNSRWSAFAEHHSHCCVNSDWRNQRSCVDGVCKASSCCYTILIFGSDQSIDEEQIGNG